MKILIVEPGQYPRKAEIEKSLAAEQAIVGGLIECVYPWKDNACIVCNDEGKLQNLPFNRTLGDYRRLLPAGYSACGTGTRNPKVNHAMIHFS